MAELISKTEDGHLIFTNVEEHICKALEHSRHMFIQTCTVTGEKLWYLHFVEQPNPVVEKAVMHQIRYCPYCGQRLGQDKDN